MPAISYPLMRSMVRTLRIRRGLTQEELAEKARIDYKYYQRFELGNTPPPTISTLERLGRVLDVKPWVMMCDEESLVLKRTGLEALEKRVPAKTGRPKKAT